MFKFISTLFLSFLFVTAFAQIEPLFKGDFIAKQESSRALLKRSTPVAIANYDMLYANANFHLQGNFSQIVGDVEHWVKMALPGSVQFNLSNNLTVDSVWVNGGSVNFIHVNDILEVKGSTYQKGEELRVRVAYSGTPKPSTNGFTSYVADLHEDVPVMWTLSEPYGAQDWWPVRQDLNDKLDSVDIRVTVPFGNYGVSNGLLIDSIATEQNITYHWKHRYPIDYYLIAIAATNYKRQQYNIELSTGTLPIENFLYPEWYDQYSVQSLSNDDFFYFFDSLIGPYPFVKEKYGHTQFGFGGGMEHQTNSFMGTFHFDITSHELAHQWFGNLVTCGSWQDIWLNESFATYLTGLCYERLSPNLYWPIWRDNTMKRILSDSVNSVFVEDTTSVARIFSSTLSYYKGALMLHQLKGQIGEEAFFLALKNYLNDPRLMFKTARSKDMIAHFEDACECELSHYFDSWLFGVGYPSYTFTWSQQEEGVVGRMKEEWNSPQENQYKMKVPVVFYSQGKDTTILFQSMNGPEFIPRLASVDSVKIDPDLTVIANKKISIQTTKSYSGLTVFPNPVSDVFTALLFSNKGKRVKYVLYDSAGKQVHYSEQPINQPVQVSTGELQPGVYTLWASSLIEEYSAKVVVAR